MIHTTSTQNIKKVVYVSILNWNAADTTLKCVESLLKSTLPYTIEMNVIVVDNASEAADFQKLTEGLNQKPVQIYRNEVNTGFAGGHNLIIKKAILDSAKFIWLLNNDTTFQPDALSQLIAVAESDNQIGAVSPVLVAAHDTNQIDFCGGIHDWNALEAIKICNLNDGRRLADTSSTDTWLSGAAILINVSVLCNIGYLDEKMFAYFEDNEICCRLQNAGWKNKIAFECIVKHATSSDVYAQRPPYYFYLMTRNSFLFWYRHTPVGNRRLLNLRLIDREMLIAIRLASRGYGTKSKACLLGLYDGLIGSGGAPRLNRPILSFVLQTLSYLLFPLYKKHI